jgi:hypothetical protein
MSVIKIRQYAETLRHLGLKQLYYNVFRRLKKTPRARPVGQIKCRGIKMTMPIVSTGKISVQGVRFLNREKSYQDIGAWRCESESKLWRYNLHYFDYLLDEHADQKIKDRLIDEWLVASKDLDFDAWEPYPLSLRIVNWIKYFVCFKDDKIPERWQKSLYQQVDVLNRSIEYHILANHLLKNVKAIFFAGCYFDGDRADAWRRQGLSMFVKQIKEQFLKDGGHYEKSPMYHSICVEDCIDVLNLVITNNFDIPDQDADTIMGTSTNALDFLCSITMPDGDIPLFNDSAFDIAATPRRIISYAERVFDYSGLQTTPSAKAFADTGYYLIEDGLHKFIIDCGSVSPGYQPGHTHCDILSYELVINGRRVVVDTGVYDYEDSNERRISRATRSHNTIAIDGCEQIDIWGKFRVGRRPQVYPGTIRATETEIVFEGSYVPYWGRSSAVCHERKVKYQPGCWVIADTVRGRKNGNINNYIHLAPGIQLEQRGRSWYICEQEKLIAEIIFDPATQVSLEDGWYYPEFGIKQKNTVINLISHKSAGLHNQCYQIRAL